MKRRRPQTVGVNTVLLVLSCIPFLPYFATAQQQHSSSVAHQKPSVNTLLGRQKGQTHRNNDAVSQSTDVRALATVAPAGRHDGDVRAPPAKSPTAGLSSKLPVRSLQDWEVEDTVLMATVDGMIHARDRKTGAPKWILENDRPMVQTTYHTRNSTEDGIGGAKESAQNFYWIVEPSQDGSLYGYTPGAPFGMVKLGLTVKQLADDLSPWHTEEPPVVYTGEKKSTLYKIDVNTGDLLGVFSPDGSRTFDPGTCRRTPLDALDDDECGKTATLTLGRTEYTVGIQSSITGEPICTIRYFEWTPNNRDRDLFGQYMETKDNRYIYSLHDGRVMALDHLRGSSPFDDVVQKPMYKHKFQSPVVRVFDIVRPTHSTTFDTPLVVLPQPIGPPLLDSSSLRDANKVFVNYIEDGSWYALSEAEYPMVTDDAKLAQCARDDWAFDTKLIDETEESLKKSIVGVHALSHPEAWPIDMPSLPPGGSVIEPVLPEVPANTSIPPEELMPLPHQSRQVKDLYLGGLFGLFIGLLMLCTAYWRFLTPARVRKLEAKSQAEPHVLVSESLVEDFPGQLPKLNTAGSLAQVSVSQDGVVEPAVELKEQEQKVQDLHAKKVTFADDDKENDLPLSDQPESVPTEVANALEPSISRADPLDAEPVATMTAQTKTKKKAHRGQRGGKREADKRKMRQGSEQADEIDGIVEGVKQMGQDITVTPDAVSKSDNSASDGLRNLTFKTDTVLGTGSGGTVVYQGEFEGRDVAVKRMLTVHYELASQEVSLLEQSEDHPNVIRYYCRREDPHFLYIALELCQASLFDLFKDRRHDTTAMPDPKFTSLITEINVSPVNALRQLAEGVKHLHALRIVHRDIKPQNMLIAYPKKNSISTYPRFVISDFGLCKTLPEGASTLIGATVNAGTTGWKAPELIHQPREASFANGSHHSASNGSMNASGEPQPGAPGVKRAVDIFSLGCVFFFVLTQGLHPFDDEEGWLALRERNIKTNRCNLSAIELHGPDTVDLIRWMLSPRPEDRPTAAEVLAHPFFWTPEDRLEFLSLASDRFDMELRDMSTGQRFDGPSDLLEALEAQAPTVIPPGPTSISLTSSQSHHSSPWAYATHHRTPSNPLTSSSSTSTTIPIPGEPNFLAHLDRKFTDTLGKQRKYNGSRLADLLRALRNKHHHWDDMPDDVKAKVGHVPEGYLGYWEKRFPPLVVAVWRVLRENGVAEERRFWRWFGGRGG